MVQSTQEAWNARFVSGNWINLTMLADSLEWALTLEASKIESHTMALSLINRLADEGDEDFMLLDGDAVFIGMPAMFRHYSIWIDDLADMLGVDCTDHEMAGEWVTDAMPQTQSILRALTNVVGNYVAEAGVMLRAERGYTPVEVLFQSLATGESFEQTATRMGRAAKGLRVV